MANPLNAAYLLWIVVNNSAMIAKRLWPCDMKCAAITSTKQKPMFLGDNGADRPVFPASGSGAVSASIRQLWSWRERNVERVVIDRKLSSSSSASMLWWTTQGVWSEIGKQGLSLVTHQSKRPGLHRAVADEDWPAGVHTAGEPELFGETA